MASAQKMPVDYFEEANAGFEAKDYDKAESGYKYIIEHHPKNELFPRAVYNLGYVYYTRKDYNSSIGVFKKILISNFNEKEDLGGSIMDDPYTLYKHRACKLLSAIYSEKGIYDTALHYLSSADTVYPYEHFCGNEYAYNEIAMAVNYAELYRKMGKNDVAISVLLPNVFQTLADNSLVIQGLKELLKDKKEVKKQLDDALANMYTKTFKDEDKSYTVHYFKFMNVEIAEPKSYDYDEDEKSIIDQVKGSNFYKMIAEL